MDRFRGFEVGFLCGAGGAEVSGVDASKTLGAETVAELRRALAEHCVIFLRDQDLTPDQQKTFARHFGPLATGTSADELAEVLRRDTPRWGEVIRKGGIKAQ